MIQTKPSLQLILDGTHDGKFNMAFDEDLFLKQIQSKDSQTILRFYRFSEPTLTIGYGMWRAANGALSGQSAVRRLTGGGIVAHTLQDLTYSLVTPLHSHPQLKKAQDSYYWIHDLLKNSFKSFGLKAELYNCRHSERPRPYGPKGPEGSEESRDPSPAKELWRAQDDKQEKVSYCFEAPALHDVMLGNRKIAGAGQKRSFGYLLHQGSIAWKEVLGANPELTEQDFCHHFANQLTEALNHG